MEAVFNFFRRWFFDEHEVYEIVELPFDKCQLDKWYTWKGTRNGIKNCKTDVFQSLDRYSQIFKKWKPYPKEFDQEENFSGYWFHGTDYDSAVNILQNGVRLNRGRGSQDFSHADGFYLTPSFFNAKNWACQDRQKPTVVVFKMSHFSFEGLYLNTHQEWQAVVRYNRSGRDVDVSIKDVNLRRRYDECDYVFGPSNGGNVGPHPVYGDHVNWNPSEFFYRYRQMCVKSEKLAARFGEANAIESIIIFL